jgi:glutamyl-tRNA(Gln) amidotransferase subunit E
LEEAREAVRRILNRMESLIKERGEAAFGPAMGAVMRELRGRVDGALLSRIVKEELAKIAAGG